MRHIYSSTHACTKWRSVSRTKSVVLLFGWWVVTKWKISFLPIFININTARIPKLMPPSGYHPHSRTCHTYLHMDEQMKNRAEQNNMRVNIINYECEAVLFHILFVYSFAHGARDLCKSIWLLPISIHQHLSIYLFNQKCMQRQIDMI